MPMHGNALTEQRISFYTCGSAFVYMVIHIFKRRSKQSKIETVYQVVALDREVLHYMHQEEFDVVTFNLEKNNLRIRVKSSCGSKGEVCF